MARAAFSTRPAARPAAEAPRTTMTRTPRVRALAALGVVPMLAACMPGPRRLPDVVPGVPPLAPATRPAKNSVAVLGSTLGVGAEVGRVLAPWLGVRVGGAGLSAGRTFRSQGVAYEADVRAAGAYGFVDVYPVRRSGFRITGGVLRNTTRVGGTAPLPAMGMETLDINGRQYAATEVGTLRADVQFPRTAPYLSLGWGKSTTSRRGVGLRVESGTTFGKLRLGLSSTGAATNPQLATDLAAWERTGQGFLGKLPGLPFTSVALTYRY